MLAKWGLSISHTTVTYYYIRICKGHVAIALGTLFAGIAAGIQTWTDTTYTLANREIDKDYLYGPWQVEEDGTKYPYDCNDIGEDYAVGDKSDCEAVRNTAYATGVLLALAAVSGLIGTLCGLCNSSSDKANVASCFSFSAFLFAAGGAFLWVGTFNDKCDAFIVGDGPVVSEHKYGAGVGLAFTAVVLVLFVLSIYQSFVIVCYYLATQIITAKCLIATIAYCASKPKVYSSIN